MQFSNIYITTFIQSIPAHQEQLSRAFEDSYGEQQLVIFLNFCCESVKNIGDQAYLQLTGKTVEQMINGENGKKIDLEKSVAQQLEENFITFDWVDAAKSFAVLQRDILVQHQKSAVLATELAVEPEKIKSFKEKSLRVINDAYLFLKNHFEESMKDLMNEKTAERSLEHYRQQENPWPIFKEQFDALEIQAEELKSTGKQLYEVVESFQQIRSLIESTPKICEKEFDQFVEKAKYALEFIQVNMAEKSGKVATYIEELENEIKLPPHLDGLTNRLNDLYQQFGEKIMLPFGLRAGMVQQKEIDFRRKVSDWLDVEILPLLYEVWEHTEALEGNLKMSLINIRNRAILLQNETTPATAEKENFGQPLEIYLAKAQNWFEKMSELDKEIQQRMEKHFWLAPIYDANREFLPLSIQGTFNNLDIGKNEVVLFFQKQYQRARNFVRRVQKDVEKEGTLSQSEKVVRAIDSLSLLESDSQYAAIFQTKGYVGESFWVGREEPLQHMQGIIDMWERGFRGGVLLVGQRLSGKTLFGEKIANLHFPKSTIRVAPNAMVKVKGKKLITNYDLGEVLDFIRKNTINEKALVWIDDLELWASPELTLGQNVRALKDFMDTFSGQLFCMVSMSNWVKAHLNHLYQIEASFQAEINLDRMEKEEVSQAIMIRHGATHKALVDDLGAELSAVLFQEKVNKIYKASNGVIGEALNRWVVATKEFDEDRVVHEAPLNYNLPDFLNPDLSVLLTAIVLQKTTTDYRLRKLFGSPYRNKYQSILQRLISLKIVIRNVDSTLEVNESIANELARFLDRKKYIKFQS